MTGARATGDTYAGLRSVAARYAYGADTDDADVFLSAFRADATLAVFDRPDVSEPRSTMRGHDEIGVVPGRLRSRYARTHHMLGQSDYVVDGTTATGYVYCTARHLSVSDSGATDLAMYIRYDDAYALDGDTWRLAARRVVVQWTETHPVTPVPPVERPAARAEEA